MDANTEGSEQTRERTFYCKSNGKLEQAAQIDCDVTSGWVFETHLGTFLCNLS